MTLKKKRQRLMDDGTQEVRDGSKPGVYTCTRWVFHLSYSVFKMIYMAELCVSSSRHICLSARSSTIKSLSA